MRCSVAQSELTVGQESGAIIVVKILVRNKYFELMCFRCGVL